MSPGRARSRGVRSPTDRDHRNEVIGTTVALILAPVVVVAFGIALLGLIEALTGWSPELVKRLTPDDSIYIQTGFTKVRVVMIGVGVGVGYVAALLIQWALHFSAPAKREPVEEAADAPEVASPTVMASEPPAASPASSEASEAATPADSPMPSIPRPAARPVDRPQPRQVERPQAQSVARSTSHRSA